jgi:neutral ceramidase
MNRWSWFQALMGLSLLCATASVKLRAAAPGTLRAGAARVDVTPPADAALPMSGYAGRTQGFKGIHDNIYVRAIVVEDGSTQIAVVAWELLFVPNAVWEETSQRIAAEVGIRPENLVLASVHDHGAPTLALGGQASAATIAYTKRVEEGAIEAVKRAKAQLQPARFGAGTGTAYVNVNRREFFSRQGWWWLGFNENGVSDKTVAVLRFEDLTGKPIAFLINYPVHAVIMGPQNYQITGDLAGATSRFVEQHYSGKDPPRSDGGPRLQLRPEEQTNDVVALWTSGTAGDQNPVSMASGEDFTLVDALGRILGEAVVRVAGSIRTAPQAKIRGAQRVISCPGRRVEPGRTPRAEYKFTDSDPVSIRLGLVMIGQVALTGVSGEVLTPIGLRLKRESPFTQTIMITHANGASGYIPDDASFEQVSYEITTTRLKPGCAEGEIVNGLLDLMGRQ